MARNDPLSASPTVTPDRGARLVARWPVPSTRIAQLLVTACCALAAALSLYHLGYKSFWLDEGVSVGHARDRWPTFVYDIRTTEANMSLYYFLLREWVRLGTSETRVRLLSCIFAVSTVPVLYGVATRLFDRTTGVLTAFLYAAETGRVWASQEARSYALAVFLTTLSWWLLLRAARTPPGRRAMTAWALYVLAGALAVYAHFYAVLVLVAQGIVLLWLPLARDQAPSDQRARDTRVPLRTVLLCGVALVALLWPLVTFITSRSHHNIDWIAGQHSALQVIVEPIMHPTSWWGRNLIGALVLVGPIAIVIALPKMVPIHDRWRYAVVLLWVAIPVAIAVSVSLLIAPVIDERYLTVCLPPLVLAAAAAITQIWPRLAAPLALLWILVLDRQSLTFYYTGLEKENWRDAASDVLDGARPGDRILFYAPYGHLGLDVYRVQRALPDSAPPRPPVEGQSVTDALVDFRAHAPRIWVVLSHAEPPACEHAIDAFLLARFTTAGVRDFHLVRVRLYSEPRGLINAASPPASTLPLACPLR